MKHYKKVYNWHKVLLSFLILLLIFASAISQTTNDSVENADNQTKVSDDIIRGYILDVSTQLPLPYANIYVLNKNKGAISNEKGIFSINISELEMSDTLRFQYIGYKTSNLTIDELSRSSTVYLKEEIFNLSETFIFGNALDAQSIVKKVLENKDSNYGIIATKNQTFFRERSTGNIQTKLDFKKSSIDQLDKEVIKLVEEKMPKQTTSYTDFLGYTYFSKNQNDSVSLKLEDIRAVSLKEKDIDELEQLETIFKNLFDDTKDEEYWKVKSGIFSQKLDLDDEDTESDTTAEKKNKRLYYFRNQVKRELRYCSLDDKKEWEFLHSTGRYKYTLAGGTSVNGEAVYIIDFTPKSSGNFIGRMYISTSTYALIRADYDYAPDKTGRDINLFGIGYTENHFSGSIYFEKTDSIYSLKYFSKKIGNHVSFDRNVALLKKSKRWLFDKKLKEIKVGVNFITDFEESFELLFLDRADISDKEFNDFEQEKHMDMVYVDQFDDKLWKGYSIIEPTTQMREYKKQEVDYSY